MTTRANASRPSAADSKPGRPAEDPAANVEKIRQIIFGWQMGDHEHRFARLAAPGTP